MFHNGLITFGWMFAENDRDNRVDMSTIKGQLQGLNGWMFNYLMGRQLSLECLSLWKEFINRHIMGECKGARSGVGHRFYSKYLSTSLAKLSTGQELSTEVIHNVQGVGGLSTACGKLPPCVKRGQCLYYTPQKKIYAKVKCPNLYTYF